MKCIPKIDSKNKKLKYEFFLLTNQIRNDLQNLNEYFKGIVMNFIFNVCNDEFENLNLFDEIFFYF